jgi:hypothetical protein
MGLLVEASDLGKQLFRTENLEESTQIRMRLAQIQTALMGACHHGKENPETTAERMDCSIGSACFSLVSAVFVETVNNKPDQLPQLFPFFSIACTDRKNGNWMNREIDWNVVRRE